MNNLRTLYGFELKKIIKNRLTIAMMVILIILTVIEGVNPGSSTTREMWDAQRSLNGRLIDDTLLNEMYSKIDAHGRTWKADNIQYYGVAYVESCIVGDKEPLSEYSAADMYSEREYYMDSMMKHDGLTEKEIEWWKDNEAKIDKPFIYSFVGGAVDIAQGLVGICVCVMLIAAMCISTVFTSEHRQRTDQIVLSCMNGRKETYIAKIMAGFSIIIVSSILAAGFLMLIVYLRKGLDGFSTIVQMEIPMSGYSITLGEFITIQLVILFIAGILFAAFAMAASELIKNSMAVMGIMVGLFIFSQIEIIPDSFRLLSQIRSMIPSNLISLYSLMEYRLVSVGRHLITEYVASPIIYLIISIILVIVGGIAYNRFQVTGR